MKIQAQLLNSQQENIQATQNVSLAFKNQNYFNPLTQQAIQINPGNHSNQNLYPEFILNPNGSAYTINSTEQEQLACDQFDAGNDKALNPNLLQQQHDKTKKIELIKILVLIIVGIVIEFYLFKYYIQHIGKSLDDKAQTWFFISLVILLMLIFFGSYMRKFPLTILIYLGQIFFRSFAYFFFCRLFNDERPPKEDGFYITVAGFVSLMVYGSIQINGITTILICIQCIFQQNSLTYVLPFLLAVICIIPTVFLPIIFIPGLWIVMYGFFLINALNQVRNGRFQLKVNEVFTNTNAVYYGITIPFS